MDRIVVADDHPLFRAALRSAVEKAAPGAVIAECASLAEVQAAYDVLYCDLWGCLHDGRTPFPAAVAARRPCQAARLRNRRYCLSHAPANASTSSRVVSTPIDTRIAEPAAISS